MVEKKYWYKFHTEICPLCGRETFYKERQETPKPKELQDRYDFKYIYDWCEEAEGRSLCY